LDLKIVHFNNGKKSSQFTPLCELNKLELNSGKLSLYCSSFEKYAFLIEVALEMCERLFKLESRNKLSFRCIVTGSILRSLFIMCLTYSIANKLLEPDNNFES